MEQGRYYWVKGLGVCRCVKDNGSTVIVSSYVYRDDSFWGRVSVARGDVLYSASDQDVADFRQAVRDRLSAPKPVLQTCSECLTAVMQPQRPYCPRCGVPTVDPKPTQS